MKIAWSSIYRMRSYRDAELHGDYPVSCGQATGRKRRLCDCRTPKGMYFVIKRRRAVCDLVPAGTMVILF
jgi:hypothetical protein